MALNKQRRIKIVGAGFSGLSLAYYLNKGGCDVEIYEKGRVGGLLGTTRTPFGIAEQAANGILASQELVDLCQDIGLEPLFSLKNSKKRFFYRPGRPKPLTQWPLSALETLALGFKILWRILQVNFGQGQFRPQKAESLEAWGYRNATAAATQYILQPAMNGIYAATIRSMSATLILGRFFQKNKSKSQKNKKIKGLISFSGGMQQLVDELKTHLEKKGVRFLTSDVQTLSSDSTWVVATSAPAAAELTSGLIPACGQALQAIRYLPVVTTTAFFARADAPRVGFGCLFSEDSRTQVLGVLWNSFIFPNRSESQSETWIMGGNGFPEVATWKDSQILQRILETRQQVFAKSTAPLFQQITKWPAALPHYSIEIEDKVEFLKTQPLRSQNIFLHGNYLGSIGLSQILKQSYALAQDLIGKGNS